MTGMSTGDILGMIIGLVFTLMVFSYLLGDNGLFRFAIHVFIGAAAGYVLAVAFTSVIWPRLVLPLLTGAPLTRLLSLIPLGLSLLLLAKIFPRLSGLGSPVMALLVGVGAAVAVGGVVLGTIFPQVQATANLFDLQAIGTSGRPAAMELLNVAIILVGVIASLAYFRFYVRSPRPAVSRSAVWVGQGFIAIALGMVFAGVYSAAITALVERLDAIVSLFHWLLGS